jgi:hypothetical protein
VFHLTRSLKLRLFPDATVFGKGGQFNDESLNSRNPYNKTAIEEILLLAECSLEGEWEGQINFLPLK